MHEKALPGSGFVLLLAVSAPAQCWFKAPQLADAGRSHRGAADLDGDGLVDLLTLVGGTNVGATYEVRLGQGACRFVAGASFPRPPDSTGYDRLIDVDGDGLLDLVYTVAPGGLAILPGQPGATFGAAIFVPFGASGSRFRAGDSNNDGISDVAVTGYDASLGRPVVLWVLGDGNRRSRPRRPDSSRRRTT